MGIWADVVLPRLIIKALGSGTHAKERGKIVPLARGRVLELGFGSGPNLPFYDPSKVDEILSVDPITTGLKLGADAIAACPIPLRSIPLEGAKLPIESQSVDTILSTWTLCTIPDLQGALLEAKRVLKPGGTLLFLEHGLSPNPSTATWQRRIDPLWSPVAGGCHLSRDIPGELKKAGWEIVELEAFDLPGPGIASHHFRGVAEPQ